MLFHHFDVFKQFSCGDVNFQELCAFLISRKGFAAVFSSSNSSGLSRYIDFEQKSAIFNVFFNFSPKLVLPVYVKFSERFVFVLK